MDGSVEGVSGDKLIGAQFHPEGAPGPQDGDYLFDQFVTMMKEAGENA
jgi:carbamoyl-phosphate synthase small subunit